MRPVGGATAAEAALGLRAALAGAGVERVVAVGGDGTVALAADQLAGSGVPLGIVPAGTGDDLARALGVPRDDPVTAARIVSGHAVRRIDLGCADVPGRAARRFTTVLASGFDARVADRAARMRWIRGRRRYDLAVLAELGVLRPLPYEVGLDDRPPRALDAVLVAVGCTPSYGGGLRITPGARVDDGLLDVLVVRPVTRRELVRIFPRLRTGRHVGHPAVEQHRARVVRLAAPGATAWADGEPVGPLPLQVRVLPGALRVLVPRRASDAPGEPRSGGVG